jgi:putative PIN family toxin of toxin-antitoxin system
MRVVIDTNVLLVIISPRSPFNWLWQALLAGSFELGVTTDILDEYHEIITQKMGISVGESVLDLLTELPNIHFIQKYFHWQLIEVDPDDNKFADCAIGVSADFLITHDNHFTILNQYPYFNIKLVSINEMKEYLKS